MPILFLILCLNIGLSSTHSALAQDAQRDPKAQALIDPMIAAYRALTSFYEEARMRATIDGQETPSDFDTFELRLQRPNKLRLRTTRRLSGKTVERQIVCDGVKLWQWESGTNTYTQKRAPATIREIDGLPLMTPEMDVLFRDRDPFLGHPVMGETLMPGSPAKLGDADMDVLEWITPAQAESEGPSTVKLMLLPKDHLVRHVTLQATTKNPASGKATDIHAEIDYVTVEAAPAFKDSDFIFTPPPGSKLDQPSKPVPKPTAKPSSKRKKKSH